MFQLGQKNPTQFIHTKQPNIKGFGKNKTGLHVYSRNMWFFTPDFVTNIIRKTNNMVQVYWLFKRSKGRKGCLSLKFSLLRFESQISSLWLYSACTMAKRSKTKEMSSTSVHQLCFALVMKENKTTADAKSRLQLWKLTTYSKQILHFHPMSTKSKFRFIFFRTVFA